MISEVKRTPGGAILLDGIKLRDETVAKIKSTIVAAGSPKICLATVLVGDDAPSHIYVGNKHKKAQEAGMVSRGVNLPATATQAQVEQAVAELVADKSVHGILVQLPLPKHIDTEAVLSLTAAHVKPGATVIDVGVTRIDNKIVGDVDFEAVQAIAGAITPMPGGTGPMTIACLLENTLEAARMIGAI